MIKFTKDAIDFLELQLSCSLDAKLQICLQKGGCSGKYLDLYPLKELINMSRLQSNQFEIYVINDYYEKINNLLIEISCDIRDQFLTIKVDGDISNGCFCKKSFELKSITTDLAFDNGTGLIGSFCQN